MSLLLLIPDLFFGVKVADAARALGYATHDVRNAQDLLAAAQAGATGIIIDTQVRSDWQSVVRTLKADAATVRIPVLAFAPHVDVEAARAALAAGCDRIVTRGKFASELPELLGQLFPKPAQPDT